MGLLLGVMGVKDTWGNDEGVGEFLANSPGCEE